MDEFGDRMKQYEMAEAGRCLIPLLPIMVRLDGRAFHTLTSRLQRPYDERFSKIMVEVTKFLVEESNAKLGYTQSDEISLVLHSDDYQSQVFFDGRIQKLVSVLASLCTAKFVSLMGTIEEFAGKSASFDCRVWNVPNKVEAANTILWRELDATKNSISMATRTYYSHKEVDGKNGSQMQEMLFQKGINWNNYPDFFKRGTYVQRRVVSRKFTADEIAVLPEKHEARKNPELVVERSDVSVLSFVPPLSRLSNREEFVFGEAMPILGILREPNG
jgi:tRNA(His) 5'-end guanylyltransferase